MAVEVARPRPPARRRRFAAQLRYENRLLRRSPMAAFSTLVLPVMILLAVVLLNDDRTLRSRGGIDFDQFFTPATVAFAVMVGGYVNIVTGVALARERGVIKRIRGTPLPLPLWLYFAGRVASSALVVATATVAIVATAVLVYDVTIPWDAMPAAALTIVVGLVCFAALGFAGAALTASAQDAMAVAWGTLLPLLFISDVFLPLDSGPAWLRGLGSAFPPRHLALALETAFNPRAGSATPSWDDLAVLLGWAAAGAIVAVAALRRET